MTAVIIGAGPAGLYTAIKCKENGLDVLVLDPRAGEYTRPGFLQNRVFQKMNLDLNGKLGVADGKPLHIKDLERKLYKKATDLGITIKKHEFMGLYADAQSPGILVEADGVVRRIPTEYVFDCTGRKRAVVDEVNRLDPDSPMQQTTIKRIFS